MTILRFLDLKDNENKILHLGRNYARIFVLEFRSRKTVRFSEQIMSADKYPSIFLRQMAAIVYLSIKYFRSREIGLNTTFDSRKTVHYSEQIISAERYPSIFSSQIEATVYILVVIKD